MIKDFNRFVELAYQKECVEEEMLYIYNKLSSEEKQKIIKECRQSLSSKIIWKHLNEEFNIFAI